jgi:hypothetical protein
LEPRHEAERATFSGGSTVEGDVGTDDAGVEADFCAFVDGRQASLGHAADGTFSLRLPPGTYEAEAFSSS